MKKNPPNPIARNIKKYRLINHMTQEELAEKIDLDPQYYAQLERGERNFTIEKIISLCSVFHIGVEDIIEVEAGSTEDTEYMVRLLASKLEKLSHTQLSVVDRFITEIIPYIR